MDQNEIEQKIELAARLLDEKNFEESFKCYREASEEGSTTGKLMLGWMYQTGTGCKQDFELAEKLFLAMSEEGYGEAKYYLGQLYEQQKKHQNAIRWLAESAEQNYTPALYRLGKIYALGIGVSREDKKALAYFQQAASLGHIFSQRELACRLLKCHGGLLRVPEGILKFMLVVWRGIKLSAINPDSNSLRK